LRNLRLTVEYDGTDFSGFQWQPSIRSVASVLESALERLFCEPVKVTAAGRTDSGVHASGQVISFSTERAFPMERLAVALNSILPRDCSVRDAAEVRREFSARFSARERTYVYTILNRRERSALSARYAHYLPFELDLAAMQAAGAHLVGEHDFRWFCAGSEGTTVRTVRRLQIERRGAFVRVEIAADGFLHRMVRIIVGTLLECGTGRRGPDEISAILRRPDRPAGGPAAPPQGLCLAGVRYDDYDSFAEPPLFC
jgi:tRNA pseudouridine38-40 synthase